MNGFTSKNNSDYNGWTNYETWRVNLEFFDGLTPQDLDVTEVTPSDLREMVEEHIYDTDKASDLVKGWAWAFVSEVNWQEIADAINEAAESEES